MLIGHGIGGYVMARRGDGVGLKRRTCDWNRDFEKK